MKDFRLPKTNYFISKVLAGYPFNNTGNKYIKQRNKKTSKSIFLFINSNILFNFLLNFIPENQSE